MGDCKTIFFFFFFFKKCTKRSANHQKCELTRTRITESVYSRVRAPHARTCRVCEMTNIPLARELQSIVCYLFGLSWLSIKGEVVNPFKIRTSLKQIRHHFILIQDINYSTSTVYVQRCCVHFCLGWNWGRTLGLKVQSAARSDNFQQPWFQNLVDTFGHWNKWPEIRLNSTDLGEVEGVSALHLLKSIPCSTESVNLLMGITNKNLCTTLSEKNVWGSYG